MEKKKQKKKTFSFAIKKNFDGKSGEFRPLALAFL